MREPPRVAVFSLVAVLSLIAGLVAYRAPVEYSHSDPWGALLTSQAILEHGSIRLDPYSDAHVIADLKLAKTFGEHLYYFHPLGTPLLSLPAVWIANRAGLDMRSSPDNTRLQLLLSALAVALSVPLIHVLCRFRLGVGLSLASTIVLTFGSAVMSSLGSAWWSADPTFLLNMGALILLLADARGSGKGRRLLSRTLPAAALGLLLGISYLCRPTAALLIVVVTAYLTLYRRRALVPMLMALAVVGGLFVAFSWREYGALLPPYYQPSRLGDPRFGVALVGNLISPSRGLFVLHPYLPAVAILGLLSWPTLRRDRFFWFGAAWFTLHWLTVSSYNNWWGAWCFGNRLFADAMPAIFLMAVAVLSSSGLSIATTTDSRWTPVRRWVAGVALVLGGGVAIWIHSHQGLYAWGPFLWCQDGTYVKHLFDWRHPQFLASRTSMKRHRRAHLLPDRPPVGLGVPIEADSRSVLFEDFSRPEGSADGRWRWTDGPEASLLFRLDLSSLPASDGRLRLELIAGTFAGQPVDVTFAGVRLGAVKGAPGSRFVHEIDRAALEVVPSAAREGSHALPIEVSFAVPEARRPPPMADGRRDPRRLGLRFARLTISRPPSGR